MALQTKTCSVTGCNNKIWSKGVCFKHTPKTSIVKTKSKSIPKPKDIIEKINKRNDFFMSIWKKRAHNCVICGIPLGSEPRSYYFDHLLEKSKYPELEFEESNIALVCLECHDKKTRGYINAKYQEMINFVITKYNIS